MRTSFFEDHTVEQIVRQIPEARSFLREARIDRSSVMAFRDAAAAVSVNSDELLAQIEDRIRRHARRIPARVAETEDELALA